MVKRKLAVIGALACLSWLLVLAVCAVPSCVFAQPLEALAPVADAAPTLAAPAAAVVYDPDSAASQAFDAITIGDWWALAAILVTLATYGIRTGAAALAVKARAPRLSAFLLDPVVSFCLPIALAAIPGTVAALVSGTPFTLGLLLGGIVKVAGGSKLLFLGIKNAIERRDAPPSAGSPPGPAVTPKVVALLPFILLAGAVSGCKTVDPYLVTGSTLHESKVQFIEVSRAMRDAKAQEKISPEEFKQWASFSDKFAKIFERTVGAWEAAQEIGDDFSAGKFGEALGAIGRELLEWYAKLKAANLLPKGAP